MLRVPDVQRKGRKKKEKNNGRTTQKLGSRVNVRERERCGAVLAFHKSQTSPGLFMYMCTCVQRSGKKSLPSS